MSAASISELPKYLYEALDEVELRGCPWKDAVKYIRKAKSTYKPHLRHLVIRECMQSPSEFNNELDHADDVIERFVPPKERDCYPSSTTFSYQQMNRRHDDFLQYRCKRY